MNEIKKEEVFGNLKSFLKSKGVQLQGGSYTETIRRGCDILTDSVNLSQRAFEQARQKVGKGLEQLRQAVHERTAPASPISQPTKNAAAKARTVAAKSKTPRRKKASRTSARRRRS